MFMTRCMNDAANSTTTKSFRRHDFRFLLSFLLFKKKTEAGKKEYNEQKKKNGDDN